MKRGGTCDDCGAHGATYEFPNRGERVFVVAGEEVFLPLRLCATCHERRWWNDPVLSKTPIERARDGRGVTLGTQDDGWEFGLAEPQARAWRNRIERDLGLAPVPYREPVPSPGFWTPERVAAFAGLARRAI